MSVRDITPDSVVAAVQAGHDDIFKLAEHFEVMHLSHTLRSTVRALVDRRRLVFAERLVPLMAGARLVVAQ